MSSEVQSKEAVAVNHVRGYCETVDSIGACLRTYVSENQAEPLTACRTTSARERAHQQGEVYSPLNGRQPIFALLGYDDIRSLEGKLLTIVDASFSDQQQRKAVKDLVRNALWWDWVKYLDTDDHHVGKPDLNA